MASARANAPHAVSVENALAGGGAVIACDHASNAFPERFGTLGLPGAARQAHIAWDPGALGLARALARRLDAPLVAGRISRLVYDCNRPPDASAAMTARSETYDIPGNLHLTAEERLARTEAVYLPYHQALQAVVARRLAAGRRPALIAVHSFTPVWFGQPRAVELGVIHDADPALSLRVLAEARARTGLRCELNAPYSAEDGVTHTMRLHATPHGLESVMIEVRNDLIATPEAETAMADLLAPVLAAALLPVTEAV